MIWLLGKIVNLVEMIEIPSQEEVFEVAAATEELSVEEVAVVAEVAEVAANTEQAGETEVAAEVETSPETEAAPETEATPEEDAAATEEAAEEVITWMFFSDSTRPGGDIFLYRKLHLIQWTKNMN